MRLRNVKNCDVILNNSRYFINNPETLKGLWQQEFNNNNKIMLEIGMGKGDFIIGMATLHPDWNFIGVERSPSVAVRAIQKLDKLKLDNVKVFTSDAICLDRVFNHEIDTIYLNFSDPWPKKRHAKRRLTHQNFLEIYDKLFIEDAKLKLKTDNDTLFESSLISLNNYGYMFDNIYLNLWEQEISNVKTEYEIKFASKGYKIKYVSAIKKIK